MGWKAHTPVPKDWVFGISPKGWADGGLGLGWITRVFEPCTLPAESSVPI